MIKGVLVLMHRGDFKEDLKASVRVGSERCVRRRRGGLSENPRPARAESKRGGVRRWVGGGKSLERNGRMNTRGSSREASSHDACESSLGLLAIKSHPSVSSSYCICREATSPSSDPVSGRNEGSEMRCKKVRLNEKFQFFTTKVRKFTAVVFTLSYAQMCSGE